MGDDIRITVIATGFERSGVPRRMLERSTSRTLDQRPAHQCRQHFCPGDVADRRHRQVARGFRNFEIGQDRAGELPGSRSTRMNLPVVPPV
jgi:hypothetical protein